MLKQYQWILFLLFWLWKVCDELFTFWYWWVIIRSEMLGKRVLVVNTGNTFHCYNSRKYRTVLWKLYASNPFTLIVMALGKAATGNRSLKPRSILRQTNGIPYEWTEISHRIHHFPVAITLYHFTKDIPIKKETCCYLLNPIFLKKLTLE